MAKLYPTVFDPESGSPSPFNLGLLSYEQVHFLGRAIAAPLQDIDGGTAADSGRRAVLALEHAERVRSGLQTIFVESLREYLHDDPRRGAPLFQHLAASRSERDVLMATDVADGLFETHPDLVLETLLAISQRDMNYFIDDDGGRACDGVSGALVRLHSQLSEEQSDWVAAQQWYP